MIVFFFFINKSSFSSSFEKNHISIRAAKFDNENRFDACNAFFKIINLGFINGFLHQIKLYIAFLKTE